MMYVIQIKQRILRPDGTPRMAPIIMNYSLGEHTDRAFLYRHRQELGSFFTNCQVLGIVPLDSLDAAEQESVKSHLKIAKERPEFPQYQILQYLEAMAQAEKQTAPTPELEQQQKTNKKSETESTRRYTTIDPKLALGVYHALQDGENQIDIAEKFKFNESQFRKNNLLKEAKKLARTERDEKKAAYRLMTVSGALKERELEDGKSYIDYDNDDSFDSFD